MHSLYIEVNTAPKPKGSVSAFPFKRKNGKMGVSVVHSKDSKDFEKVLREHLSDLAVISGPVAVELWFWIEKPKTVSRPYPSVPGDIDKLTRSVLDALDHNWEDDSRVVDLHAYKRYASEAHPVGVWVYVREKDSAELTLEDHEPTRRQRATEATP